MGNVLALAPSETMTALLGDLGSTGTATMESTHLNNLGYSSHNISDGIERAPRSTNPSAPFNPGYERGDTIIPTPEPGPDAGQGY